MHFIFQKIYFIFKIFLVVFYRHFFKTFFYRNSSNEKEKKKVKFIEKSYIDLKNFYFVENIRNYFF